MLTSEPTYECQVDQSMPVPMRDGTIRPPHLKTLFVTIGGAHRNYCYRNNVYRLSQHRGMAFWFQLRQLQHETAPPGLEAVRARLEKADQNPEEMDGWFRHLPLRSFPPGESMGKWFLEVLDHPADGPYWWATDTSLKFDEIDVPIVHVGGWFDFALDVALSHFSGIQRKGRTEDCRNAQRLIVGPWGHLNVGQRQIGEMAGPCRSAMAYCERGTATPLSGKN